MDNRRVYKKQNRKQTHSKLASRVKSFFAGSLWRKLGSNLPSEQEIAPTQDIATPEKPAIDVKKFTTPKSVVPAAERTPNAVLSDFFQRKGDKPLNEIEYEGVMSLLSALKGSKPSYSRVSTPSVPHRSKESTSAEISTPSEQKVLKNSTESPRFATPEYRPAYQGARGRSTGAVKRVYQFSGLPSPYKTKIRPISSPQIKKKSENRPKDYRSINKAASTLLSVLDNDLLRYSNPYKKKMTADAISKSIMFDKTIDDTSSSATTPTSVQIHAGAQEPAAEDNGVIKPATLDLASLFLQPNVAVSASESSAPENPPKSSQTTLKPEVTQTNSNVSVVSGASGAIPSKNEAAVVANDEDTHISSFNVSSTANAEKMPATVTGTTSFRPSTSTSAAVANASAHASNASTAHFAANSKPAPAASHDALAPLNNASAFTYDFPTVVPVPVTLDTARVNSFKHLFSF